MNSHIRLKRVTELSDLDKIHVLNYSCYLPNSYCSVQKSGRLSPYRELDTIPETTITAALMGEELIGSISFTVDGPSGLHVDKDFPDEVAAIRAKNTVCSSWRILTSTAIRNNMSVVLRLIRDTLRLIQSSGADICLFTFNPKHEHVYQRILGLKTIAHKEETDGLNNAPAVLMSLSLADLPHHFTNEVH